jgi:hypothetical protein
MALRIAQKQVEQFKKAMEYFLPHYLSLDADLPDHYDYEIDLLMGLIKYKMMFTNIKYDAPDLDIRDTEILFEQLYE